MSTSRLCLQVANYVAGIQADPFESLYPDAICGLAILGFFEPWTESAADAFVAMPMRTSSEAVCGYVCAADRLIPERELSQAIEEEVAEVVAQDSTLTLEEATAAAAEELNAAIIETSEEEAEAVLNELGGLGCSDGLLLVCAWIWAVTVV